MKTEIKPISAAAITEAAALLQAGQLVAFPTETVYGLGANALNSEAVSGIFAAKGRPGDNPLIAHIHTREQANSLAADIPEVARSLMQAFWPGPLTLVLPAKESIPRVTTGGLSTIGIRLPAHRGALALLKACGFPVAAPSANASGRPSPTTAAHVMADLGGRIPLILDGGPCEVGLESTVLDVTGSVPVVLRPGGIAPEQIQAVAGCVRIHESTLRPLESGQDAPSPGMKYRHYAPQGEVLLIGGADPLSRLLSHYDTAAGDGFTALILAPEERKAAVGRRAFLPMGHLGDMRSFAQTLFSALREADALGAQRIFVEAVPAKGIGLAVQNRLLRAAGFRIEED